MDWTRVVAVLEDVDELTKDARHQATGLAAGLNGDRNRFLASICDARCLLETLEQLCYDREGTCICGHEFRHHGVIGCAICAACRRPRPTI